MPYKHGVTGSSPVVPTTLKNAQHYVLCFFMCRETTSGSNKAASPPLRTPCAPVPRSHCTLASKCKHSHFAVDEPCCPHQQKSASGRCAVFVVWDNLWARTQPNGWRTENACVFLRYAPCLKLQTLSVALLFIFD